MEQFLQAVRRLQPHERICWQRPRQERTLVFERADEAAQAAEAQAGAAREVEVYCAGERRYVVYIRW
jgi:hypothetical protein